MTDVELMVAHDPETTGGMLGNRLVECIRARPDASIGVATGSSPLAAYRRLADAAADGLDVTRVTWFALDEYVGLPRAHPQRYRAVLERELLAPMGLTGERLYLPGEDDAVPERAAVAFERRIRDTGGIDLQILGIGTNGHIGFNEPGSSFRSLTRRVTLATRTTRDNARFFNHRDQQPSEAVTQGIATIMSAKSLALIATGDNKAKAIARALAGPMNESCPASVLRSHSSVSIYLDTAAAALLT